MGGGGGGGVDDARAAHISNEVAAIRALFVKSRGDGRAPRTAEGAATTSPSGKAHGLSDGQGKGATPGMTEGEFLERWSADALIKRAKSAGGEGFTDRLRGEVKALCVQLAAEKSVMVVRLLEAFTEVAELFAAEHREMEIVESSPAQGAWYAGSSGSSRKGDLHWLNSLRHALAQLLSNKNLDRPTRVTLFKALVVGFELFGQELLVERDGTHDGAGGKAAKEKEVPQWTPPEDPPRPGGRGSAKEKAEEKAAREKAKAAREAAREAAAERGKWVVLAAGCARVELGSIVGDAVRGGIDQPPAVHVVPLAVATARVLEYCVAYLLDDNSAEGDRAFDCHPSARWSALSFETVAHLIRFLSEAQHQLLWYFQETRGRVATDRDVALYPLLQALMAEFADGEQDKARRRVCAMFKRTGVLESPYGLAQ